MRVDSLGKIPNVDDILWYQMSLRLHCLKRRAQEVKHTVCWAELCCPMHMTSLLLLPQHLEIVHFVTGLSFYFVALFQHANTQHVHDNTWMNDMVRVSQ